MMKGRFYFIPILFDQESGELTARPKILEPILSVLIWFHQVSAFLLESIGIDHNEQFPIHLYQEPNK